MESVISRIIDSSKQLTGIIYSVDLLLLLIFLKSSKLILNFLTKLKFRASNDISNFSVYPDSNSVVPPIKQNDDPFLSWFM
jgi:hypothetical protein